MEGTEMTGLLFLSKRSNLTSSVLDKILDKIQKQIKSTLYIYFHLNQSDKNGVTHLDNRNQLRRIILKTYECESRTNLDCRLLLSHLKKNGSHGYDDLSRSNIEYLFTDTKDPESFFEQHYNKMCKQTFNNVKIVTVGDENDSAEDKIEESDFVTYDHTVLGGTFDHLHSGHKVLLSEAVAITNKQLTIGVTDNSMLKNKLLSELVEPFSVRKNKLRSFLRDIDNSLKYDIVPISDPYGPSIVIPDLQCIVVSDETYKGGLAVNDERQKRNLSKLAIHGIKVIADEQIEGKISSTNLRQDSLGKLCNLSPESAKHSPYVIGLTGGIASGKSSIAKYLGELGAHVIDCDKLGHRAYTKDSRAFKAIINEFGADIVDPCGEIDRKKLGAKVFSQASSLKKLNEIVWPEIKRLLVQEIEYLKLEEDRAITPIVVVEAAVLFEATWDHLFDQIWVGFIPKNVAIQRIVERNGIIKEEAQNRIESQMTNSERIQKANAVFCSLWDTQVTQKQVKRAWDELQFFLSSNK